MALPDYLKVERGTEIVWGEAGGAGVTHTLSVDALAAGSARMGAEVDLGSVTEDEYELEVRVESGAVAPAAGGTVEVFLAWSGDGATYPGGVSGADGAWPADGNEDEWKTQLGVPESVLVATNDANTVQVQNPVIVKCRGRWVAPVIDNNMSQAFRDQTTASDNLTRVILRPRRLLIQD